MKTLLEEYPGLKRFLENRKKTENRKGPLDFCNLYVLQTEDLNGNIIEEHYATNVITDTGMSNIYMDSPSGYNSRNGVKAIQYILVGQGTTPPDTSDRSLEEPLNLGGNVEINLDDSATDDQIYPVEYDNMNNLLYQHRYMGKFVLDYNYPSLTEDTTINELGLCFKKSTSDISMSVRMLVYDENMHLGIVKRLNQKITISVFFAAGMRESLITDLWSNGIYALFNPARLMCLGSTAARLNAQGGHGYSQLVIGSDKNRTTDTIGYYYSIPSENSGDQSLNCYGRSWQASTDYSSSRCIFGSGTMTAPSISAPHQWKFQQPNYDIDTNYGSAIRTDVHQSFHYLVNTSNDADSRSNTASRRIFNTNIPFAAFRELWIPDGGTETVSSNHIYTTDIKNSDLRNAFGWKTWDSFSYWGELPVMDIDITSSYMYNHAEDYKGWNIADSFMNYPNTYYGNMGCLGFEFNSTEGSVIVHFNNKHSSLRISSITADTSKPIFCTDKYWDPSTYVEIPDISNIPDDANNMGKKKYYLMKFPNGATSKTDTYTPFYFNYAQNVHKYTANSFLIPDITIDGKGLKTHGGKLLASDEYNIIILCDKLYVLDSPNSINTVTHTYTLSFVVANTEYIADYRSQMIVGKHFLTWSMGYGPISVVDVYDLESIAGGQTPTPQQFDFRREPVHNTEFMSGEGFILTTASSTGSTTKAKTYWSSSELGYFSAFDPASNNGYVLNMTGASVTSKLFSNVNFLHMQEFTNYIIYMDATSAVPFFHVVDLRDDSETTFELPEGYTVNGVFGCSDYFYISTTDSNYMYLYIISSDSLVRIDKILNVKWDLSNKLYTKCSVNIATTATNIPTSKPVYAKEGLFLVRNFGEVRYISFNRDPTAVTELTYTKATSSTSFYYEWPFAEIIRFKNDTTHTEQLLFGCPNNVAYSNTTSNLSLYNWDTRSYVSSNNATYANFDAGLMLDTDNQSFPVVRKNNDFIQEYASNESIDPFIVIPCGYKNGIICHYKSESSVRWIPKECVFPHSVTGTTHTITAVNNPVKIRAGGHIFTVSNVSSIYEPYTEETEPE